MDANTTTSSINKAVLINFIGKYSNVIIHIFYGAILARILSPEDFGIVAVVTVFTSFFSLIANMGIGPAVIQNKELDDYDIKHIFSLTVYVGFAISLLLVILSYPISLFYNNNVYILIVMLLAISLFFNTINIVPNAILLKTHRFKLINIRLVLLSVFSAIPTIILALWGFKYYSIVFYSIFVAIFTFIWNYHTVKLRFTFRLDKESTNKIKTFSSFQLGFSLINYFSRNSDNLLIGKFIGVSQLGYYDKSYRLMLYPVQNLTHVITPVLHPILSMYQNDKKYIYEKYINVVKILSLLGIFASIYSFFSADEIITIIYGSQWIDSIPSFRFLALSIWAQMVTSSTGSIFQSIGNTKLLFINGTISAFLIVGSIIIGITLGSINTVAICVAIAYNINFIISFFMLIHIGLKQSVLKFFRKLLPDFVVFIITFGGLYAISLVAIDNLFLSAGFKLVVGGLIYLFSLIITRQTKYVMKIIFKN